MSVDHKKKKILGLILFHMFVTVQDNDVLRAEFEANDIAMFFSPFVPSRENKLGCQRWKIESRKQLPEKWL